MHRAKLTLVLGLLIPLTACAQSVKGVKITGGGIGNPPALCGGVPNFCSPTDTLANATSAPAGLQGATGLNATITDVTGNKVIRASDFSMSGGTTATASFRSNSDSNDNVWSIDDKMFGFCRTGGTLYIDAFDPVNLTVSPKGATSGKGGCDLVTWLHATPASYVYATGTTAIKYVIDPTSPTWTGSAGGNTNISGAIDAGTTLFDFTLNCSGLTFEIGAVLADPYGIDVADQRLSFGIRPGADEGFQVIVYDKTNGCHWVDFRTMTQGGAWGSSSMTNSATILLPTPAAPAVTAVTNGSGTLTSTHAYRVCYTNVKSLVGETPCSPNSTVTVTSPNNAISVTPPTTTPSGTASAPDSFNFYACDNTASPGCTPVMQSNGTNSSGQLLQPTGLSAACILNCSGSITHTFWMYAINAGGQSPISAAFTTGTVGANAKFTVTVNQVTNAATYTLLTDALYNSNLRAQAGSCSVGVCTFTEDTNPNNGGYHTLWNNLVPIATTPVITTLQATGVNAPATNATGWRFHDVRIDVPGTWVTASGGNIGNTLQSAYSSDPRIFVDVVNGVLLFASNTSTPSLNAAKMCFGHMVVGWGTHFGNECGGGQETRYTLSDTSTVSDASGVTFPVNGFTIAADQHFSVQMQYQNSSFPFYAAADGSNYMSHAVPATYLTNFMWAVENVNTGTGRVWKFCQNWESGLSGFNTQVSGNISPDGKFILFASDLGIGAAVTSGQLGNTSGGASCTDNVDCRTDAFVCVTR